MSHVDEGALHAYLDGALDAAYGTSEAARIREHILSCATCAERLDEERALRSAAASILSSADPPLDDLPTLEEMRAQAVHRTSGAGGAGGRMWKMAWAASIMMALGTGWMAHQITVPSQAASIREENLAPRGLEADAEDRDAVGQVGRAEAFQDAANRPSPAEELQEASDQAGRAEAFAESRADAQPAEPLSDAVISVPVDLAQSNLGERGAGAGVPAATAPAPVESEEAREEEGVATGASSEDAAKATREEAPAELSRRRQDAAPERQAELRFNQAPAVELDAISVQGALEASVVADMPVAVPGLEIVSVSLLQGYEFTGGIRVLQLLEGGESLEILQLPREVDPSVLSPLTEGMAEWIAPRPDGWLVLRARIDPDSLAALGRRITRGG